MGKIGSIIGQAGIAKLRTKGATGKPGSQANPYQGHVMQIYALFMFLGIFTTLCIPETKRKTLEELSGDNVDAGFNGDEHVVDNVSEEAPKERVATEHAAL
jgi:PHS family inorganic phosphate transporter-like MFS transporter